jgi:peptidoglycan/xylan/chitin deacetylase (PgdA/CDA1 family)
MKEKAHGLMFHHFHDDELHIKGQGSIDQEQFRKMIILLQKEQNLISADKWYIKATTNTLQDTDVCITFDDNLQCQYDIALPVLEEFNLKAFWFMYTSPLEGIHERLEVYRYFRFSMFKSINDFYNAFNSDISYSVYNELVTEGMKNYDSKEFLKAFSFYTEEDKVFRFIRDKVLGKDKYFEIMDEMISNSQMDIKEIAKILWIDKEGISYLDKTGHIVGLHSHSHPTQIKELSFGDQLDEYTKGHTILSSIINQKIKAMSHPCNSYNSDTLKVLEKLNVFFGFRANMEEGYTSKWEYPRLDHAHLINKI